MYRSRQQNGFTIIELLLIIVILVIIGFVGWLVYHGNHAKSSDNNAPAESSSSAGNPSVSQLKSQDSLVISAWGVKMPTATSGPYKLVIPAKVNGAENPSAPFVSSPSGNLKTLALELSGMSSAETSCSPNSDGHHSVGSISRDTTLQTNSEIASMPHEKVGNYYYFLDDDFGSNCIPNPTAAQQAFLGAIKTSFFEMSVE